MSKEVKIAALSLYEQMSGTYTEMDGIFYPNMTLADEIAVQNDFWVSMVTCGRSICMKIERQIIGIIFLQVNRMKRQ